MKIKSVSKNVNSRTLMTKKLINLIEFLTTLSTTPIKFKLDSLNLKKI